MKSVSWSDGCSLVGEPFAVPEVRQTELPAAPASPVRSVSPGFVKYWASVSRPPIVQHVQI